PVDSIISKYEQTPIDQESDLNTSDEIPTFEKLYSGQIPLDNHANPPEGCEKDEPSFEKIDDSSEASSGNIINVEDKIIPNSFENKPHESIEVNVEIKKINQEISHSNQKDITFENEPHKPIEGNVEIKNVNREFR
ncbi:hypothetical protein, partial [Klebsiella pneumoniae]|uniref:hypothetical protein n=1 Tax=Klebsiella pneumoniae TaxID=573 RepID=UPI00405545AF